MELLEYKNKGGAHQDRVFQLLFEEDEVTWQTILYDLVKTEDMDPWDIDLGLLTQKFLEMVSKLKEMNFRISGKIILASAILLKMKSYRLVGRDIAELDKLFAQGEETEDSIFDEEIDFNRAERLTEDERMALIPRIPQPRKRKVSIYDLVGALEQALQVKKRRVMNSIPEYNMEAPEKTKDITVIIKDLYGRIKNFLSFNKGTTLTFSRLIPSDSKLDKVYTFIPLLHLSNQRKVDLLQEEHFGDFQVLLRAKKEIDSELAQT